MCQVSEDVEEWMPSIEAVEAVFHLNATIIMGSEHPLGLGGFLL